MKKIKRYILLSSILGLFLLVGLSSCQQLRIEINTENNIVEPFEDTSSTL